MDRKGQSLLLVSDSFCHANSEGNHACEVEVKYPLLRLLRRRILCTICLYTVKRGCCAVQCNVTCQKCNAIGVRCQDTHLHPAPLHSKSNSQPGDCNYEMTLHHQCTLDEENNLGHQFGSGWPSRNGHRNKIGLGRYVHH